jgi:hypothetical protein
MATGELPEESQEQAGAWSGRRAHPDSEVTVQQIRGLRAPVLAAGERRRGVLAEQDVEEIERALEIATIKDCEGRGKARAQRGRRGGL